ncbi:unnamed protein product [Chondrus crispus]|uniref:Uncharacterized protein n=1 Tax=Chondrus crispus TaxID=2769 RepID=R7QPX2_CHOCR|nr:unnamed protein product [Chondrus crispus]CDF39440.1 unnamed protein product [Chondrus crispus]|eukprot:XP_005719351.1 unnamed protein product [Chondrus crispus]
MEKHLPNQGRLLAHASDVSPLPPQGLEPNLCTGDNAASVPDTTPPQCLSDQVGEANTQASPQHSLPKDAHHQSSDQQPDKVDHEQVPAPCGSETAAADIEHSPTETPQSPQNPLTEPASPVDLPQSPQLTEIVHTSGPTTPPPDSPPTLPSDPSEDAVCHQCAQLCEENDSLTRRVARLRQRLRDSFEQSQTHGQRLLRAAYQEKIQELSMEHAHRTTEVLNMQKQCFEQELEALESESQAAINSLTRERDAEREARVREEQGYRRERQLALDKTTATMIAVQRKMAQLHARATRLERDNKNLTAALIEKQIMVEVLASAAAAKDVERRRLDLLSRTQEEERNRKDSLIAALQAEVGHLREELVQDQQANNILAAQVEELKGERDGDRQRMEKDLDDCKQQQKKESDRLGRLFTSMIQDFATVQIPHE